MKPSNSDSYYSRHRLEVLEKAKLRRELNPEHNREVVRRWRELHPEEHRKRSVGYDRKWRSLHPEKSRILHNARFFVKLGSCCELCGSTVSLQRYLPDPNNFRIAVTVCRECKSWINKEKEEG